MPEYEMHLRFTAADSNQAERLAAAWADTCAAEYGTRYAGLGLVPSRQDKLDAAVHQHFDEQHLDTPVAGRTASTSTGGGMSPDQLLRWEHDRLLTMLADLARRNGGTLTFSQDRIIDAPALPFAFFWDDATRSIIFRVYEDKP